MVPGPWRTFTMSMSTKRRGAGSGVAVGSGSGVGVGSSTGESAASSAAGSSAAGASAAGASATGAAATASGWAGAASAPTGVGVKVGTISLASAVASGSVAPPPKSMLQPLSVSAAVNSKMIVSVVRCSRTMTKYPAETFEIGLLLRIDVNTTTEIRRPYHPATTVGRFRSGFTLYSRPQERPLDFEQHVYNAQTGKSVSLLRPGTERGGSASCCVGRLRAPIAFGASYHAISTLSGRHPERLSRPGSLG